jgi:hypothetical protein
VAGQGRSELDGFELLEIPGGNLGFFREMLLRQSRASAPAPEVAAQKVDLFLRDTLHRRAPMLAASNRPYALLARRRPTTYLAL